SLYTPDTALFNISLRKNCTFCQLLLLDWRSSLNTHKYESLSGPNGEEIFEAYVENKTPAAFRVFWYYGFEQGVITILTITPHP
ncbi:MAG: hypothetical protein V7K72_25715, partial [Nostoc sp.]